MPDIVLNYLFIHNVNREEVIGKAQFKIEITIKKSSKNHMQDIIKAIICMETLKQTMEIMGRQMEMDKVMGMASKEFLGQVEMDLVILVSNNKIITIMKTNP